MEFYKSNFDPNAFVDILKAPDIYEYRPWMFEGYRINDARSISIRMLHFHALYGQLVKPSSADKVQYAHSTFIFREENRSYLRQDIHTKILSYGLPELGEGFVTSPEKFAERVFTLGKTRRLLPVAFFAFGQHKNALDLDGALLFTMNEFGPVDALDIMKRRIMIDSERNN